MWFCFFILLRDGGGGKQVTKHCSKCVCVFIKEMRLFCAIYEILEFYAGEAIIHNWV